MRKKIFKILFSLLVSGLSFSSCAQTIKASELFGDNYNEISWEELVNSMTEEELKKFIESLPPDYPIPEDLLNQAYVITWAGKKQIDAEYELIYYDKVKKGKHAEYNFTEHPILEFTPPCDKPNNTYEFTYFTNAKTGLKPEDEIVTEDTFYIANYDQHCVGCSLKFIYESADPNDIIVDYSIDNYKLQEETHESFDQVIYEKQTRIITPEEIEDHMNNKHQQIKHTFIGWKNADSTAEDYNTIYQNSDKLPFLEKDSVYVAQFSTLNYYNVIFSGLLDKDYDYPKGTVAETTWKTRSDSTSWFSIRVLEGTTDIQFDYDGLGYGSLDFNDAKGTKDPINDTADQFKHTFNGWVNDDGSINTASNSIHFDGGIKRDQIFTAKYTHEKNQYTVRWLDDKNDPLNPVYSETITWGENTKFNSTATKPSVLPNYHSIDSDKKYLIKQKLDHWEYKKGTETKTLAEDGASTVEIRQETNFYPKFDADYDPNNPDVNKTPLAVTLTTTSQNLSGKTIKLGINYTDDNSPIYVDWSDGGQTTITKGEFTHTYSESTFNTTIKVFSEERNINSFYLSGETGPLSEDNIYIKTVDLMPLNEQYKTETTDTFKFPKYAFKNCTGLSQIKSRNDISDLGENDTTIPSNLSFMEEGLFDGCTELRGMRTGNNIKDIRAYAFRGTKVSTVDFSEKITLTKIDTGVFANCNNLQSITLPSSITNICESAFSSCVSLNTINFITAPDTSTYVNHLKTIGTQAFAGCNSLVNFNTGNMTELTYISEEAFKGCSSLSSINTTGMSALEIIGASAFEDCSALTTFNTTDMSKLFMISSKAFYGCNFDAFTIPSTVKLIGSRAFTRNDSKHTNFTFNCTEAEYKSMKGGFISSTWCQYPEDTAYFKFSDYTPEGFPQPINS